MTLLVGTTFLGVSACSFEKLFAIAASSDLCGEHDMIDANYTIAVAMLHGNAADQADWVSIDDTQVPLGVLKTVQAFNTMRFTLVTPPNGSAMSARTVFCLVFTASW